MSLFQLFTGVMGEASIMYKNEGCLFVDGENEDVIYIRDILSEKIKYN